MSLSRQAGLFVLGLTSAAIVATEVLVTRLLSVSTWYGLAFLVLSIAMLGVTSGSLAAMKAQRDAAPMAPWIARRLLVFAIGLVGATIVILSVPISFTPDVASFASLLLVIAAATVPMVAGGSVVARLMAESPVSLPAVYAVDLVAAAGGALLPLAMLGPMSGPGAMVAVAVALAGAASVLAENGARRAARGACAAMIALLALTELTSHGLVVRYAKGVPHMDGAPLFDAWNPLSYVALTSFAPRPFPLWSYAPTPPPRNHPVAVARIDGDASTVVYAYSTLDKLELLKSDATSSAHALRPDGTACVIGTGGGRDIEAALLWGHDEVVGFEINPAMVAMLQSVAAYSPILRDHRVRVIVGDGRTELARSGVKCRVLQASLVDTWAATSAGAFAHTESTLYTREAWSLFLRRVEPDGVLTFSRWYDPARLSETSRLVALAVASLLDRGAARPRDHIALVAASKVATMLVSPTPLSADDLTKLRDHAAKLQLDTLVLPGEPSKDPLLDAILDAPNDVALAAAGASQNLDTSAPTDDRPFFFQILSARAWLHPIEVTRKFGMKQGALSGNVASTFELLLTFGAVLLVAAFLLGPTLVRAAREAKPPLPGGRAAAYFAALGAGFMIAEIALIQRMHVVLGHPTYALVVVLAGLLVATGIGSALSAKVVRSRAAVSVVAALAAALLIATPFAIIRPLARATMDAPYGTRVLWTAGCSAALGLVMGMLFPAGLRFADRERAAPVALALNGATSVLGSVAAIMISVWAGIPTSFVVAGCIYLVAAACGPARWRAVE